MMTYVIGAMVGLLVGGVIGLIKNRLVWGTYINREASDGEAGALYSRMLISNIINLVTLVIVFFLRDIVPFDGIAFLIGTAAALALMNRALSVGQKKNKV